MIEMMTATMITQHTKITTTGTTTAAAIHVRSSESESDDDEWDETVTEKSVNTINNKYE